MQSLEAKCAWLKHDWNMTGSLRLMRQLTSQDVPVKQGRALSLPLVRAWGGRLFLHEYQVEECSAEPLVAVIANSCKLHIPPPSTHTHTHFFLILPPSSLPCEGLEQSNRIGQSWHHRFCLCYVVRKLRVWCNRCSLFEITEANRKSINNNFTKVWVFVILLQTTTSNSCWKTNLLKSTLDHTTVAFTW